MTRDDLGPLADTKPWWASKTLWGSAVGALSLGGGLLGYSIDAATQSVVVNEAVAALVAVGALVSTLLTTWGRLSANKVIG